MSELKIGAPLQYYTPSRVTILNFKTALLLCDCRTLIKINLIRVIGTRVETIFAIFNVLVLYVYQSLYCCVYVYNYALAAAGFIIRVNNL